MTGQTKKGRVNNRRILSENRRPEIYAENERFPAKTRGLESLHYNNYNDNNNNYNFFPVLKRKRWEVSDYCMYQRQSMVTV